MDFQTARNNMIEQQIRTWEVLDPSILTLLSDIHREDFVPQDYKLLALSDYRIPLGYGQTTMTPKEEARILQALRLESTDRVLEIGTGCGYLTALLATTAEYVTSVEYHQNLSDTAAQVLNQHGLDNVRLLNSDIRQAMPKPGCYDVIVVTASSAKPIPEFAEALTEGGRLLQIIGQSPVMEALLLTRTDEDACHQTCVFETDISPLIGYDDNPVFQF